MRQQKRNDARGIAFVICQRQFVISECWEEILSSHSRLNICFVSLSSSSAFSLPPSQMRSDKTGSCDVRDSLKWITNARRREGRAWEEDLGRKRERRKGGALNFF